jgi:ADP-L-glycero-D-manno-heptose 6-epimerase
MNMYAYSKHLFDCHAFRKGFLHMVRGIKYFNVFGPNEGHKGEMRSVVLRAFEQIRDTGKMRLFKSYRKDYADGHQKRDFLYVEDAARLTLFLGRDKPSPHLADQRESQIEGGLFNVGRGRPHTWLELVTPVFSALNRSVNIEFIDMPEALRPNYQYFTRAKIIKLRRQSGFHFRFQSLERSVRNYVLQHLLPASNDHPTQ